MKSGKEQIIIAGRLTGGSFEHAFKQRQVVYEKTGICGTLVARIRDDVHNGFRIIERAKNDND